MDCRRSLVARLKAGTYTLTYGDGSAIAPRYDLTFRKRVPYETPHLSLLSIEKLPESPLPPPDRWMVFLKTYGVWIVLILVMVQLLYMVFRMLKKKTSDE